MPWAASPVKRAITETSEYATPHTDGLRVLLVSSKYPPEYSGSGHRAHATYKRLSRKFGVSFDVLSGSVAFNRSESYTYEGVGVQRIARKLQPAAIVAVRPEGRQTSFVSRLAHRALSHIDFVSESYSAFRFLMKRRGRYDLFHVFGDVAVTSAAIGFAKRSRIPLLVEFTSDRPTPYPYAPGIVGRIWRGRLPEWSKIVCISEKLARMCHDHGYVDNVWSRPNPVDETRFFPEPERKLEYRKRHTGFGNSDVVLCYVAKFMPSKNQLFLIDVLRRLPDRYKLFLGGPLTESGPLSPRDRAYFDRIQTAVHQHGLDDRVELVSKFVDRAEEYMKASDVYVFPSIVEGLGTPVLEAIACGVPVVANRIAGVTDRWITEGMSGYLADLDAAEFAEKIDLATRIPLHTLMARSQAVLEAASTQVIDQTYWEILNELSKQEVGRHRG